jgi:hypothetical protein
MTVSPSSSLYLGNSSSVHDYLKKVDVTLVAANSPDHFLANRPIDQAGPKPGGAIREGEPGRQAERARDSSVALNDKYDEPQSRSVTTLRWLPRRF